MNTRAAEHDMTLTLEELDFQTQLVHAGERLPTPAGQPVAAPIYTATTYTYPTMEEFDRVFAGADAGYFYARNANPTTAAFETAMRILEGGAGACAYASGMAALHAALHVALFDRDGSGDARQPATVLAASDLYGVTAQLLRDVFGAYGVAVAFADFGDAAELRRAVLDVRPRVLLAETISNPLLKVCDLEAVVAAARGAGARVVIDNTFASPYLCQPLRHGVDFVVHSATKYLGGHGDAVGGVVVARDEAQVAGLRRAAKLIGGVLGAWAAHELLRGTKTLGLRMERSCSNACRVARRLREHKGAKRVFYPEGSETKGVLRAGCGGALVSIRVGDDTRAAAFRFMERLRLCVRSTSLGDVFTGVLHPATASHRDLGADERARLGITDGLVRVSVGIEDFADLIADIEQALAA